MRKKTANSFTTLAKVRPVGNLFLTGSADKVGGNYLGEDGGLKLPSSSTIREPRSLMGFTLIEVVVAIAVFMVIITAFSGIFMAVHGGWRRQTVDAELIDNLRWAFSYMTQEIRQSDTLSVVNPSTLSFGLDTDSDGVSDLTVWYWRGDSSSDTLGLGDMTVLYRGTGNSITAAYAQRQPLARFIVDNSTGNSMFIFSANTLTIELTGNSRSRFYSLRSLVRPRNV